jgi:hypothetical protein
MHMCAERSGFSFSKFRTVIARKSIKSLRTNEFLYCGLFRSVAIEQHRRRTGKHEMEAIALHALHVATEPHHQLPPSG